MSTPQPNTSTVTTTISSPSLAEEAIEAIGTTLAAPSILNVLHDLTLAHTIYAEVKAKLTALPPTNHNRIIDILKAIF